MAAGLAIPFAFIEAFLPRIQLVVLAAVSHILPAVESTPVVMDCVRVVTELSSLLERRTLIKIAVASLELQCSGASLNRLQQCPD